MLINMPRLFYAVDELSNDKGINSISRVEHLCNNEM